MSVTLINKQRRMQVFDLDHPTFRVAGWGYHKERMVLTQADRSGLVGPRVIEKWMPGSLRLLALESRAGLPDQILALPAIKRGVALGQLAYLKESPPPRDTEETTASADPRGRARKLRRNR